MTTKKGFTENLWGLDTQALLRFMSARRPESADRQLAKTVLEVRTAVETAEATRLAVEQARRTASLTRWLMLATWALAGATIVLAVVTKWG